MKYKFEIISTIDANDHSDKISIGDDLYLVDDDELELFETADEAYEAGKAVLNGLDGGRAYNLALETADVIATEHQDLQSLAVMLQSKKKQLTVFLGMRGNVCLTSDVESITMNGNLIQLNLESTNYDDVLESPDFRELTKGIKNEEKS